MSSVPLRLRLFMRDLHLIGGLVAVVFLVVLGFTGSIMAFETDIDRRLNPSRFRVVPHNKPLPFNFLAAAAFEKLRGGHLVRG
jgi:uncharacterized iron-regulated membrane protein